LRKTIRTNKGKPLIRYKENVLFVQNFEDEPRNYKETIHGKEKDK
jgi:hypothetical protein